MKEKYLSFGTAGIRGTEGEGFLHMNETTVFSVAVGVRDYIMSLCKKNPSVLVGFDTRIHSKKYEQIFVDVMSASMIKTYCFKTVAPTPLITFGTKFLNVTLGIIITSSHNPKDYNGIKVVEPTGVLLQDDKAKVIEDFIFEARQNILQGKLFKKDFVIQKKYTKFVPQKLIKAYQNIAINQAKHGKKQAKIVYTPLHGTGAIFMPKILKKSGFKNVYYVPEQMQLDPTFPTCPYPNPEVDSVFDLAINLAKNVDADAIVASDPDADRMGAVCKVKTGEYKKLSGNDVGLVLAYYVLSQIKDKKDGFVVSTVVSSPYIAYIAKFFDAKIYFTLTGFKNIGQKALTQSGKFLFGYEQSCGYLTHNKLHDKDGISAIVCFANLVDELKQMNMTVFDYIEQIHQKIGFAIFDAEANREFKNIATAQQIIKDLREQKPVKFAEMDVENFVDFLKTEYNADFLKFEFKNASLIIRPSGTEPKLKFYAFAKYKKNSKTAQETCEKLLKYCKTKLK